MTEQNTIPASAPAAQTTSATTATEGETQNTTPAAPAWLIPGRAYDMLKWLALILLPALAVFIGTVGPAWGWPHIQAIVVTVNAVALLIGAGIGVSTIKGLLALAA
jgi:hypothetical protein